MASSDGADATGQVDERQGDESSSDSWWTVPTLLAAVAGDANGDGIFNTSDLVKVFQAGEYEDRIPRNSTFEEGDWDGDGDFTAGDLVLAFQQGNYAAATVGWAMPTDSLDSRWAVPTLLETESSASGDLTAPQTVGLGDQVATQRTTWPVAVDSLFAEAVEIDELQAESAGEGDAASEDSALLTV